MTNNKLLIFYKKPGLLILDLLLLNLALFFSFYLRLESNWIDIFKFSYLLIISIMGFFILYFSRLYNKIWKYASIEELYLIIKVSIFINLAFVIYIFLFNISIPRSIPIFNFIIDVFLLGGLRFSLRLIKEYFRGNNNNKLTKNVLIIGAGDAAELMIREMQKHSELGKEIVGLIDDDPGKQSLEIHGKKVLGNRLDIPEIINKHNIKEAIIAIPSAAGRDIKAIYDLCKQNGVEVKVLPCIYEIIDNNIDLSQLRSIKVEDLLRREPVQLDMEGISASLQGKTVLITGGGGSIGSELSRQVARFNPARLVLFDIYENDIYFLELELQKKHPQLEVNTVIGSIQDQIKLNETFKHYRPDVVFHAAAHKHVPLMEFNPEEAVKNNIFGTRNCAIMADKYAVDRFVLISTDKAVNPTSVMGASKRVAEMIIQAIDSGSKTRFMAVRFGNVLGSNGSVIPYFKQQIASRESVTVTHSDVKRYFMTIPEAAQLVIQAGALGRGGEVFVLDMGEPIKIVDLARDLIRLSGLEPGEDIEIVITGLRPGEKLYEELLHKNEDIATEHEKIYITNLEKMDVKELTIGLDRLEKLVGTGNREEIIGYLKEIVPTYGSDLESIWEQEKEVAASKK
jgi:FlaA1/EpsC-like NDP-sugar epimerase